MPDSRIIESLTPDVLTRHLRRSPHIGTAHDVVVSSVSSEPVGMGQMATSYRLTLQYSSGPATAPSTLIAKLPSSDEASRAMASSGAYMRETRFYRELSRRIDVRVPLCHHAEVDDSMLDFLLLLEDMCPATTVDQLTGCSVDQAALAMEQAAALHGSSWRSSVAAAEWLRATGFWAALVGRLDELTDPWLDRLGSHLEDEHVRVVSELGQHSARWLPLLEDRRTLWHGDFRLDNLLFQAQGGRYPVTVLDWQSLKAGPGVIDVSYFLGNSLVPTVRIEHERDLVAEYHRRMTSYDAVSGYSPDDCWLEYRAHAVYGLVLAIAVSMGVQQTPRGDAMFGAMAARAASQVSDLQAYAALATLTSS